MARHLRSCSERQDTIAAADRQAGKAETLVHLQIQDAWAGDYWLHLEMSGSAPLADLDHYLRTVWLECCGHLSRFSEGGWGTEELPFDARAAQVFEPGAELTHIYDFGTSSVTRVKAVSAREGKSTVPHPLALMARNEEPRVPCMECEENASWLCMECIYEHDEAGTLCAHHAEMHAHDDYGGLLPLVNSPRAGLCGYEGPAEPPY